MDREELPFKGAQREWVKHASDGGSNALPFGSTRDISVVGTPIFTSDPFPPLDDQFASSEPLEIGPHAAIPDKARFFFNISGMSYGAISKPAVRAASCSRRAASDAASGPRHGTRAAKQFREIRCQGVAFGEKKTNVPNDRPSTRECPMANRYKSDLTRDDVTPQGRIPQSPPDHGRSGELCWVPDLVAGQARAEDAWDLTPTDYEDATNYNNFYEFGTDKSDPARHAGQMTTEPWSIEIDGMVDNPGTYSFEDVVAGMTIEERIYRLRCVRTVVDGDPVERVRACRPAGARRRAGWRALRGVRDAGATGGDAGPAGADHRVALSRGSAPRRGDASAHDPWRRGMYDERCRTRTARRSASWCRGSTVTSRSSRSSASH